MKDNLLSFNKVFIIAGSEPLGSAGLQADIKAVSACGSYAAGAITCIVDEDTQKVKSIHTIPVELVYDQSISFLEDVGADCLKTGMLYSSELVETVAKIIRKFKHLPTVIDPVMVNSAGTKLLCDEAIAAYKKHLFPQASIITPNIKEAELLLGHELNTESIREDLATLCQWGNAVIVKSVPSQNSLIDFYYNPKEDEFTNYQKEKIDTKNVNGTGDTFSSAIAAYIAQGYSIKEAIQKSESYIDAAIRAGAKYRFGSGFGPVQHFYDIVKQ